jgi:potassium-transporting ATPase potassium-binding subunit
MAVLWIIPLAFGIVAETSGSAKLPDGVAQAVGDGQAGGNMEGKEIRFGPGGSTLLTLGSMGTTAAVTNSAVGSYTPIGQAGALVPILLSEVSPGGVGGGLIGMLLNVVLATFIAGLMVGRTPMYLGKRIGAQQIKLTMLALLVVPAVILAVAAAAVTIPSIRATTSQGGAQGLSEILYAAASTANGNGSAMAGLNATGTWWTTALGLVMLAGRFLVLVPVIALAGSLTGQTRVPSDVATLDTASGTFTGILFGVVVIVGALTFLPALALTVLQSSLA